MVGRGGGTLDQILGQTIVKIVSPFGGLGTFLLGELWDDYELEACVMCMKG